MHLLNWDSVTRGNKYRRLGIKKLMEQTGHAILAIWWWRFNKEKDSICVKVVRRKYGTYSWLPHLPTQGRSSFEPGFMVKVYSVRETSFQEEIWAGNDSLKPSFPRLYQISSQRNAKVKDILEGGRLISMEFTIQKEIISYLVCVLPK